MAAGARRREEGGEVAEGRRRRRGCAQVALREVRGDEEERRQLDAATGDEIGEPGREQGERACARLAGARAPSSRPPGRRPWSWLITRARQPGCWTRDLPLMLVGGALCAPSLLVAVAGTALGSILCALPSRLSAEAPLKLRLFSWSADVSSAGQGCCLPVAGSRPSSREPISTARMPATL